MYPLSVVIISRNEEAHIAKCLQAVTAAAAYVGGAEVVLVDSASTDRTVEIAHSFGIRVLSLRSNWEISPSAGRFVGFHKTHGDLIMFIDGDTVIDCEWLRVAIPYFSQAEVAGVMGFLNNFSSQGKVLPYFGHHSTRVVPAPWLRGIGMYRRLAMDQVGTFNPHLTVEEEAELAFRLRKQGWRLLQVPHEMGNHLNGATPIGSLLETRYRRRFARIGRTLRYALKAGNGAQFIFERNRATIIFLVALMVLLAAVMGSLLGHRVSTYLALAILVVAPLVIVIRQRSFIGPVAYLGKHCLTIFGLLAGFISTKVKDPLEYPLDVAEEISSNLTDESL